MQRYSRGRFIAFGLLPAVNAVALLLHGLNLSTRGTGGAADTVPLIAVLAIICLLGATMAAIKRGRDVGWPALLTIVAFWVGLGMGPVLLIIIGYLSLAKSVNQPEKFGNPPKDATAITWMWAMVGVLAPWITLLVAARVV